MSKTKTNYYVETLTKTTLINTQLCFINMSTTHCSSPLLSPYSHCHHQSNNRDLYVYTFQK